MASIKVEIHLHTETAKAEWYQPGKRGEPYGVLDLGNIKLFVDSESLEKLAHAVSVLQQERDKRGG